MRNRELDYHNSEMKHLNEMSALLIPLLKQGVFP
jgi:hypothetical protein